MAPLGQVVAETEFTLPSELLLQLEQQLGRP